MDANSIQAAVSAAVGQKNINKTTLRSCNVADLRILAANVGLPSSGTKPDLISMLLEAATSGKASVEPSGVESHPLPLVSTLEAGLRLPQEHPSPDATGTPTPGHEHHATVSEAGTGDIQAHDLNSQIFENSGALPLEIVQHVESQLAQAKGSGIGDSAMEDAPMDTEVARCKAALECVDDKGNAKVEVGKSEEGYGKLEGTLDARADVFYNTKETDLNARANTATDTAANGTYELTKNATDVDDERVREVDTGTPQLESTDEGVPDLGEEYSSEEGAAVSIPIAVVNAAGDDELDVGDYDDYSEDEDGANIATAGVADPAKAAATNVEAPKLDDEQTKVHAAPGIAGSTIKEIKANVAASESVDAGRAMQGTEDWAGHTSREQTPATSHPAKKKAPIIWPEQECQTEMKIAESRQAQSKQQESRKPATQQVEPKNGEAKPVEPKRKLIPPPPTECFVESKPLETKHKLIPPPPRSGSDPTPPAQGLFAPVLGATANSEFASTGTRTKHYGAALFACQICWRRDSGLFMTHALASRTPRFQVHGFSPTILGLESVDLRKQPLPHKPNPVWVPRLMSRGTLQLNHCPEVDR
jgi:hypothetical protein